MGKLLPLCQIRPAGPFILARWHLHKLKLPLCIERKTVFPLEIMDVYGSDFQKNKPQRCKIGIKNEVKAFHFGDHKKKNPKKKSLPSFPISVPPAASTVFPNLALCVKNFPTPGLDPRQPFTETNKQLVQQ